MAGISRVSGNALINALINPVMELMKVVIQMEDNCQILRTDMKPMESLLHDTADILFRDEVDIAAFFQDHDIAPLELVKTWLQLLHNSLTEAKRLLCIDNWGRRQRCLDFIVNNPRRPSKQIRHWNAFFDHLCGCFPIDLPILVTSLQFVSAEPLHKEEALLQGVADSASAGSGIKDAQAQVERWLNEGGHIHVIGVYGKPGVGKTSLLKMLYENEVSNVFDKKIWVTVPQDCNSFDLQGRILNQLGLSLPRNFDERKMKLSAYLKENFLLVLKDLCSRLDLQEVGVPIGDGKHSKVLFSTCTKDLIGEIGAEKFIEIQPLSRDEAWMLFRRVVFKDDQVPVDIEERARNVAEECKGLPLSINVVAAAMMGKTSSVHEWDNCLASMRNVDPSFPAATHPSDLDAQLYARLRYAYDALPNSHVKRCFLYCAMYQPDAAFDTHTLLEMWIGEGLVKSKQGTYLMDMAIARKYLKLLVDRFLFQRVRQQTDVFEQSRTIRIHKCIHDMAVYIGQTEDNCLFMASQHQLNFPVVDNEHCSRISVANNSMEYLPTELKCSKLVSLSLQGNESLKELPSEFLLSVTSLRVLNLSGCTQITSIPTSIGQLRMLEFLSFQGLPIKDMPEEICSLSKLQFLDLSDCRHLNSLPSQIGQLRNLKHLNLGDCEGLEMIPPEMSELTSLSSLQLYNPDLSVEMGAPASIWSLKGLKSLTELQIWIDTEQEGENSRIKDGIMGTWSEMRHLQLWYNDSYEEDLLPEDMQNMKKLQSFMLYDYEGLSLPNCKFEHLEMVTLQDCGGIRELSPLERLPNLKLLKLQRCHNLRELGIGSPNGYLSLQKLVLKSLINLECLDGASKREGWDERTLSQLRVLKIRNCSSLKRFPKGIEKLRNLSAVMSSKEWWENITWEDDDMKGKLQKIFKNFYAYDLDGK